MATTAPAPAPVAPAVPRRARRSGTAQDRRTELVLALVAATVLALCAGMLVFVFVKAWPSFEANGLSWFGDGNVDQQIGDIFKSPADPADYVYTIGALPLIVGTFLTTAAAVVLGLVFSLFTAIFIVEFAPAWLNRILEPVVRLLAAVPSVVYGLIGILVLVPFVAENLISTERKESVAFVVQLTGASWSVAAVILAVMIVPIMIAIIVDALRAVPKSWTEGAAALGVNRWRVMWTISVRTARPAIIAAVILATARALGEAIMLAMVAGSVGFIPNPFDGLTFFFEPVRPLAAAVVENAEGLSVIPFGQTIYAFAFILLVSSMVLSLGGWLAKRPMRKYGIQS
ncbi:MAG: phosphate ABC transporter permease subunit PstC [Solirubrobacteraceae bacterium]|jgi:phosphate ABC transporter permease protein PstC|nr:phosphate ABC transporter permease subunit PstC [Solirubrobacteraceae bacterium]